MDMDLKQQLDNGDKKKTESDTNERQREEVESDFVNGASCAKNLTSVEIEQACNIENKCDDVTAVDDRRILKTTALYVCFLILGLSMPLISQSIVHMEIILGETTSSMSLSFTCASIGSLLGTWICGFLYDQTNKEFAFCVCIIINSLSTVATTFAGDLYAFMATVFVQGLAVGFLLCAGQSYCVSLWSTHRLKEPIMQSMHTIWSLGAAIGPFFMKPFLVELAHYQNFVEAHNSSSTNGLINLSVTAHPIVNFTTPIFERSEEELNSIGLARYSYLAMGIVLGLSGIPYAMLYYHRLEPLLTSRKTMKPTAKGASKILNTTDDIANQAKSKLSKPERRFKVMLLCLICSFYFITMYVEGIPMSLFPTFVIKELQWSVRDSMLLMSLYFGLQCAGRVIGIPISAFLRPRTMLAANIGVTAIAYFLLIFVKNYNMLMWIATSLAGIAMASTFPSMILWLSETMEISGGISSILMTGASVGFMTGPVLAGQLVDIYGAMWIIYLLNIASTVHLVQYIAIFFCLIAIQKIKVKA